MNLSLAIISLAAVASAPFPSAAAPEAVTVLAADDSRRTDDGRPEAALLEAALPETSVDAAKSTITKFVRGSVKAAGSCSRTGPNCFSCGGHKATSCNECGDNSGWCNGECAWEDGFGCQIKSRADGGRRGVKCTMGRSDYAPSCALCFPGKTSEQLSTNQCNTDDCQKGYWGRDACTEATAL